MIEHSEAVDVWQVAHVLLMEAQNTRTGNGGAGGCERGVSTDRIDWSASVRKLAPQDPPAAPDGFVMLVLDSVYGDVSTQPSHMIVNAAAKLIRQFKRNLEQKPDVYKDYPKMRRIVHG